MTPWSNKSSELTKKELIHILGYKLIISSGPRNSMPCSKKLLKLLNIKAFTFSAPLLTIIPCYITCHLQTLSILLTFPLLAAANCIMLDIVCRRWVESRMYTTIIILNAQQLYTFNGRCVHHFKINTFS